MLYGLLGWDRADALLARLGKHTSGKGCLYIKKLADVDVAVLEELAAALATKRGRGRRGLKLSAGSGGIWRWSGFLCGLGADEGEDGDVVVLAEGFGLVGELAG